MNRTFKDAIKHRRSYYAISNHSPVSDFEIENILNDAVLNVPSAFNSQTARLVLLLGEEHRKLWKIVLETLRKVTPAEQFPNTEKKVNGSFASGYGTVLFFEEDATVKGMQEAFPFYADRFPVWSQHSSAMHQFAVWTMLEDAGFGASLQHYNPIIDEEVKQTWNLPESWQLVAQMPFGSPTAEPGEKEFNPLSERVKVFR